MQRALLRRGVQTVQRTLRDLSWTHVAGAIAVLQGGQVGARASLPGGLALTVGYDRVMLAAEGTLWPSEDRPRIDRELTLTVPGASMLPDCRWRVVSEIADRDALPAEWCECFGPYHAWLDADRLDWPLRLRTRLSGDRLTPLGTQGSKSVKELLIDCKVPAQERDTLPILECATGLVWVVGLRIDGRFAIKDGTVRVLHVWFEPQAPEEEE
jgi:tRNA(Ile)-lysidine synthase